MDAKGKRLTARPADANISLKQIHASHRTLSAPSHRLLHSLFFINSQIDNHGKLHLFTTCSFHAYDHPKPHTMSVSTRRYELFGVNQQW